MQQVQGLLAERNLHYLHSRKGYMRLVAPASSNSGNLAKSANASCRGGPLLRCSPSRPLLTPISIACRPAAAARLPASAPCSTSEAAGTAAERQGGGGGGRGGQFAEERGSRRQRDGAPCCSTPHCGPTRLRVRPARNPQPAYGVAAASAWDVPAAPVAPLLPWGHRLPAPV